MTVTGNLMDVYRTYLSIMPSSGCVKTLFLSTDHRSVAFYALFHLCMYSAVFSHDVLYFLTTLLSTMDYFLFLQCSLFTVHQHSAKIMYRWSFDLCTVNDEFFSKIRSSTTN